MDYGEMRAKVLEIWKARTNDNQLSPEQEALEIELIRKGLLSPRGQLTELALETSPESRQALLDAFTDVDY